MTHVDDRPDEPEEGRTLRPGESDGARPERVNPSWVDSNAVDPGFPTRPVSSARRALPTRDTAAIEAPEIPGVRITGAIGKGGQGVVFRGHQEFLDRAVAVKVLFKSTDPNFSARFRREAVLLASFQHSNIVACHQAGVTADDHCYMVLELVEGYDLYDYVKLHGRLAESVALGIVADLAGALRHGYEEHARTVHRDVKPQNVLLQLVQTDDGPVARAKLVDLGLARCLEESAQLTEPGIIMGTPTCMAPEQFDAPEKVDHRTDIYGLGCVLYYAITGEQAFKGTTLEQVYAEKSACRLLDSLAELGIGEETRTLLTRMLAPAQADRPQSHGELIAELERLRALCNPSSRGSRTSSRAPRLFVGATALAASAAAVALFVGGFSDDRDSEAVGGQGADERVVDDTIRSSAGPEDRDSVRTPPFAPALIAGERRDLFDDDVFLGGWTIVGAEDDDVDHWDPHRDLRGREPDGRNDHPQGSARDLGIDWTAIEHGSATARWRPGLSAIQHGAPEGDWVFDGTLSLTDSGNSPALVGGLRLVRDDGSFLEIAIDVRRNAEADEGFVPRLDRAYRARFPVVWYDAERRSLGDGHEDTALRLNGIPRDGSLAFLDRRLGTEQLPDEVASAKIRVRCTSRGCEVVLGSTPVHAAAPSDWTTRRIHTVEVFVGQGLLTARDLHFEAIAD